MLMLTSHLEPLTAAKTTLQYQLWLIFIILVLLSIILAIVVSSYVCKPLEDLTKSAKRLPVDRNELSFSGEGYQEVIDLSNTLNYALNEIKKTDNLQKDLISNVSHELRTPLTLINGYAELMRDIPSEQNEKNFNIIINETKRLSTLVDDILNIKESDYNKTYLQDMIVRFTKERAIYFTVLDNISIIEKHKDLNSCFSKFEEIAKYDLNTDLGIEYFENIENHVERLNKPDLKIPTGIRGLDKVLYGGIPVDDTCLFLFMAQPGLGKSMFMANIAANWIMLGKKVLIISLEMSEHMYSMRMDSLFASININKLKDASEGLLKRIKSLKMGIPTAQLQIKEFPTGTCSAMMIKQYLKKLKEVKGFIPDLIVLDYLNIAKPNAGGSSMNMYEKGKSVAEELRAISGEFHIPLISAIQSNRGGYSSQDIDMDNASESGGIPATADCMFGVFQLDGEREANKINLKVIKNRYGGFIGDTIPLEVDYNTLQLKDWNEDYDEEDDDNSVTSIQHDKDELDKALDEL